MSMNELEQYAHKIMRTCNILSIARTIFIFDNIDYISDTKNNGKIANISLRQKLKVQQFKISLLSQEFELKNITLSDKEIEIELFDLRKEGIEKERIIHCSQLLYNTWTVWEKSLVCINYYNYENKKICRLYVEGSTCELIANGKKELEYLAKKFEIEII